MPSMIGPQDIKAVVTGEVIHLPSLPIPTQRALPSLLSEALDACELPAAHLTANLLGIQFFQTGRFQTILDDPGAGLPVALHMIAWLAGTKGDHGLPIQVRVAVGLGRIDFLDGKVNLFDRVSRRTFLGGGTAFLLSDRLLEIMRTGDRRIGVQTPWLDVNEELRVACLFLDHHIKRWSADQTATILSLLRGETQSVAAAAWGVTQSAVAQRFQRAGGKPIRAMLKRYKSIINNNLIAK